MTCMSGAAAVLAAAGPSICFQAAYAAPANNRHQHGHCANAMATVWPATRPTMIARHDSLAGAVAYRSAAVARLRLR